MVSPTTVTPDTEPLEYTVKLFNSTKSTIIHLRPGKPLFALKTALLSATTWFPEDLPPSRIVLYMEGDTGKTDSPIILQQNCTLIVRQTPNDAISPQVSDDRGYVSNPWIRPVVKETSFKFIDSSVKHILIVDTSVAKAVMLGEIKSLPVGEHLCWISSRQVKEECKNDPRIAPLDTYWPSYLVDCSRFIIGMTPDRQTAMFRMIYDQIYQGNNISGYAFPPYSDFCMLEEYRNTFYDLTIYLEALVLSKYVKLSLKRSVKVTFVTFDALQGMIAAICQNDRITHDTLKLLVEEKDISELNILSLPSRTFSKFVKNCSLLKLIYKNPRITPNFC
ncbi:hypothetical protein BC833DRAFT_598477 [Globomyces pollinis-pini]|nr:hypothetical protein BC833DRAFT_598477 [Globomyces pollinis-pini]